MPTSSITKSIVIDTPEKVKAFCVALEKSKAHAMKERVHPVPMYTELTGDELKQFFEGVEICMDGEKL